MIYHIIIFGCPLFSGDRIPLCGAAGAQHFGRRQVADSRWMQRWQLLTNRDFTTELWILVPQEKIAKSVNIGYIYIYTLHRLYVYIYVHCVYEIYSIYVIYSLYISMHHGS